MKGLEIDAERPHRVGRDRPDRGRVHERGGGARPGRRVRRHRLGRDRRDHARRRRRLPRAQARPDDRRPAGRRDRHRRRRAPARRRREAPRSVLGDPRRRRQLRRGHALQVPAAPGGSRSSAGCWSCPPRRRSIPAFMAAAEAAPEELSTIANVMTAPPMPFLPEEVHGKLVDPGHARLRRRGRGRRAAIAPFRALATPLADMVRPMPYPEIYPPDDPEYHPVARRPARCSSTRSTRRGRADPRTARSSDARRCAVAQLRVLGGAMARVPADATAFAHRGEPDHGQRGGDLRGPDERAVHEAG